MQESNKKLQENFIKRKFNYNEYFANKTNCKFLRGSYTQEAASSKRGKKSKLVRRFLHIVSQAPLCLQEILYNYYQHQAPLFPRPLPTFSIHIKKKKEIESGKQFKNGRFKMKGVFRKDEKIVQFKLMKLKLFGDERRNMRRELVKQIRRMRVMKKMAKK